MNLLLLAGEVGLSSANAAQSQYRLTIENPNPRSGDNFGAAMAFAGDELWVGAPGNDRSSPGALFCFDAQTGELRRRVDSPGGIREQFGSTLAIVGDFVVAGSPKADSGNGAAYVFDRFTGAQVGTIRDPGVLTRTHNFSAQMIAVNDTLAFGNWIGDEGAYLFDPGDNRLLHTIRNPDAGVTSWFGQRLGTLGDDLLVVAPSHVGTRAVYLFDSASGALRLRIDDADPDAEAHFGRTVAGAGGNVIVGNDGYDPAGSFNAGAIFVFNGENGQLLRSIPAPDLIPFAGFGFPLSAHNDDVLVGALRSTSAGIETGSVYWIDPATGATRLRLVDPRTEQGGFGESFTSSADLIAVGAPRARSGATTSAGAVHVFSAGAAQLPIETVLITDDSEWKYLDDGSDQGGGWRQRQFDDEDWSAGAAPFGFGNGDETTIVNCGPSGAICNGEVNVTTYFRHEFIVNDPDAIIGLGLHMAFDDGVVAYLNGVEVFRGHLPADVDATTSATYLVEEYDGGEETRRHPLGIDPALLVAGSNVLAVEIHQYVGDFSGAAESWTPYVGPFDLRFDAQLQALVAIPEPTGFKLLATLAVLTFVGCDRLRRLACRTK